MDIEVEVSRRWLADGSASAFKDRSGFIATLAEMIGRLAERAVQSTEVSEIRYIGKTRVFRKALPEELEDSMDVRIIIRPPWHDSTWDGRRWYRTEIMDYVRLVLRGELQCQSDNPVIRLRVEPLELCEVSIGPDGEPVDGTEVGTRREA